MTDDEWQRHRSSAISAAFLTGRPVFADTDGTLRFADGDREPVPAHVSTVTAHVFSSAPRPSKPSIYAKALRATRFAMGISIVMALCEGIAAFLCPREYARRSWDLAAAVLLLCAAVAWRRILRKQRTLYGEGE